MEIDSIKQLFFAKNWTENSMGIIYRFVNEKEMIINGVSGHTYQIEINNNNITISFNSETSSEKFNLEIIDEENIRLSDNKKSFILTAN